MKKLIAFIIIAVTVIFSAPVYGCAKNADRCSYEITASYDEEERTLTGRVDYTFFNNTDNQISDLKFNLWGNAYRQGASYSPVSAAYSAQAYYAGVNYGYMTVENVENCAGWDVGGGDENILIVNLTAPVYPDESVKISINYCLKLALVNHRTGVTENTVNLGNFYPVLCIYTREGFSETPYVSCGDPFVSECADYVVNLTVPEKYTVAASGKLVSESKAAGNKILKYKLSSARDFAAVMSDKFSVVSENADGKQIYYYYYDDSNPQTTLSTAADSFKYFSDQFGEYAYPALSVVQTGFCMGGMEYPALTMISDRLDASGALYTVVHENAHQWWYAMVGNDQANCGWQDEGLAEYSCLMFFENYPRYGVLRSGMLGSATKSYRAFYSVYNQIFGDADTTMNRKLTEYVSDYEYTNIAYNKGLLLFESVRTCLGDDKFKAALKEYFKDNKFKVASPEAMIAPFAKRGDVEGIFTSFIEGKIII